MLECLTCLPKSASLVISDKCQGKAPIWAFHRDLGLEQTHVAVHRILGYQHTGKMLLYDADVPVA